MTTDEFGHWRPAVMDLVAVDGVRARMLLEECFYCAQHQTFERMKQRMGASWDEGAVRKSVSGAIRATLNEVGGSWDDPDKTDLVATVEILARRAKSWGTPGDIIASHKAQFAKVLDAMEE